MAKNDSFVGDAQEVLEFATKVPMICLPLYLTTYGKVLPGISKERMQIMTSSEVNKLPRKEALDCRIALVMRRLEMNLEEKEAQKSRKTA